MKVTKFAFVEIERQKGASPLHVSKLSDALMKKLLIEALPQGSPENEFFKIAKIDNEIFISSLLLADNEDYGLALIVQFDDSLQQYNSIGLIDGMNTILAKQLKDTKQTIPEELTVDYKDIELTDDVYEGFDNFIFSVFTQQKTLVVGEKDELKSFLTNIFEFIPDELKHDITLIANSTNLTNNVGIHALVITDEVLKLIDAKKGEYTTLFLPMKTSYGLYTSPFCKKIAKLFAEHKKESIKEELLHFYKLALESDEMKPIADFAADHDLALADASLIQWIRANHYEIKLEKSFYEQLE
ncbi:MAG: hypothetical protein ACTSSH_02800 [Candidatus Heimdallarchaeota archaeon]